MRSSGAVCIALLVLCIVHAATARAMPRDPLGSQLVGAAGRVLQQLRTLQGPKPFKVKGALNGVLWGHVGLDKPLVQDENGNYYSNGSGRKSDCKSWHAYGGLENAAENSGSGPLIAPSGERYCDTQTATPNNP